MTTFGWIGVIVFTVGVVAMVVFDIVLARDRIIGNTFSQLARASVRHTYWLPFGLAALMGRWFHPVAGLETVVGSVWFSYLVFAVFAAILVLGLESLRRYRRVRTPAWVLVLAGFPLGTLLIPIGY
ncbi:hypothetical protein [Haliangium sp.]|uniref:hypothetical protein n=1 Tax=Haliangium sp. TaxID=2663208 RepID=UPI003D0BB9FD